MGSWFSNLHIRQSESITKDSVCNCITKMMAGRMCTPVEKAQEADFTVVVAKSPDSQWISVYSDAYSHDDPLSCKEVATPFSSDLHTDVMGISCFDSDYLYLNLINADQQVDAWVGIGAGKEIGITRRNNLTAWKKKVQDHPAFSDAAKAEYICADMFLSDIEGCLGLSFEQASADLAHLQETTFAEDALYLYFRQEEGAARKGPDLRLWYGIKHTFPCFDGLKNDISILNVGEEFYGLTIYFMGSFVENEDITFSDVKWERFQQPPIDIALQKVQLPDGQWAYCCHDPEILFPPKVPRRMTWKKRSELELRRMRKLTFVPHGDPRKMLDVTIVIIPDGFPENRFAWNIWKPYGSKEELIKFHNDINKRILRFTGNPDDCLPLLKKADYYE